MTFNDRKTMTISADSRALIRAAIKRNPGWKAYAEANDCDLGTMCTRDAIFDCADALSIDLGAVISAGPQDEQDEPKVKVERKPRLGATLLDGASERDLAMLAEQRAEGKAAGERIAERARQAATTPQVPHDAAQQLLGLIASLAPKADAVDMTQVHAAIDAQLRLFSDGSRIAMDAALDRVTDTMFRLVNEAQGVIKIELGKAGEFRKLDGHHHPQFAKLLRALASRQADGYAPNVWISGPAGSGKTHAGKKAAEALSVAFHYNGALSMPHELLGFIDAAGTYHRTPFRDAYEHGGVYLFDEVDGSDNSALLALNAALANGRATFPDGQIERHKDCYIVATANTWGLGATADYVGRSKIDAAFLSRFPVRLAWDYDAKLEKAISGNPDFAARVQKARASARKAGIKVLIDPRASIAGAALIAGGFTEDEAAELTYLANLTAEQRKMVEA